MKTQNLENEDLRKKSFHNNETLRQVNTTVESLSTSSEALKTQIYMLAQTPLEPFPEKHADVVTTSSEVKKSKILRRVIMSLRVLVRKE